MTEAKRRYTDGVPPAIETRLRDLCRTLPGVDEERAWVGTRWMVRKRTFAHVLGVEVAGDSSSVVLVFRAAQEEAEALRHAGHPFIALGWGRNAMGLVLDHETDWDEVHELVTESFCVMAPKKLIALVDRPPDARRLAPRQ